MKASLSVKWTISLYSSTSFCFKHIETMLLGAQLSITFILLAGCLFQQHESSFVPFKIFFL